MATLKDLDLSLANLERRATEHTAQVKLVEEAAWLRLERLAVRIDAVVAQLDAYSETDVPLYRPDEPGDRELWRSQVGGDGPTYVTAEVWVRQHTTPGDCLDRLWKIQDCLHEVARLAERELARLSDGATT